MNDDEKPDLVVVNEGTDDVSLLLGDGNGRFLPERYFPVGLGPTSAAFGDFNRDGALVLLAKVPAREFDPIKKQTRPREKQPTVLILEAAR